MAIPVYAVTGFIDAGKTAFLNQFLSRPEWQSAKIGVIQFEVGETTLTDRIKCEQISMESAFEQPEAVVAQMHQFIGAQTPDVLWIEWNGMLPAEQLQVLLDALAHQGGCQLKGILHVANANTLPLMLGRTGRALISQVADCDCIAMRGKPDRKLITQLKRLNPGVKICPIDAHEVIAQSIFKEREHALSGFLLSSSLLAAVYLAAKAVLTAVGFPFNTMINIFLGIMLQALPFLLIGVLLSSALQIFVPQNVIERHFPKSIGLGMLFAVFGGFCLPVCDCASIPIFRSLLRKGVPMPAAVTFMLVTPVINPWVIASTYYAFSGDLFIVTSRVCFGIIAAILIGSTYILWPAKAYFSGEVGFEGMMCSCDLYEESEKGHLLLYMRHAQETFFNVGKYLVVGTLVSAVLQTLNLQNAIGLSQGAGAIGIMMLLAFVLSLCSSSDAIVARSFLSQFSLGAIMGFIVFGPMMDIKNVLMLSSSFTKQCIFRLLLTTFVVCFGVVYLLSETGRM